MAVATGTVGVASDKAYLIVPALNANANQSGYTAPSMIRTVTLANQSAKSVYLGDSTLTPATAATNGFVLLANTTITISVGPADTLYGISAQFTVNVSFIATS